MRFWDTSVVVPLLLEDDGTRACRAELDVDTTMVVWWATEVECVSAVSRREREGTLAPDDVALALDRLDVLKRTWLEVLPTGAVRTLARRLLRVHALRTSDSLQLAAAIVAAENEPSALPLVCSDRHLAEAARREGFAIVLLWEPSASRRREDGGPAARATT